MPIIAIEPVGVTDETAAAMLEISTTTLHKLKTQGLFRPPRQVGGSARWCPQMLREDFAALPESALLPPPKKKAA